MIECYELRQKMFLKIEEGVRLDFEEHKCLQTAIFFLGLI